MDCLVPVTATLPAAPGTPHFFLKLSFADLAGGVHRRSRPGVEGVQTKSRAAARRFLRRCAKTCRRGTAMLPLLTNSSGRLGVPGGRCLGGESVCVQRARFPKGAAREGRGHASGGQGVFCAHVSCVMVPGWVLFTWCVGQGSGCKELFRLDFCGLEGRSQGLTDSQASSSNFQSQPVPRLVSDRPLGFVWD